MSLTSVNFLKVYRGGYPYIFLEKWFVTQSNKSKGTQLGCMPVNTVILYCPYKKKEDKEVQQKKEESFFLENTSDNV